MITPQTHEATMEQSETVQVEAAAAAVPKSRLQPTDRLEAQ